MRRRARVTVAIAMAVLAVIGASAQRPVNDEPTDLKSSQCWSCHSDSTNGPPIRVMYLVHGLETSIPVGGKGLVEVGVENGWTAELRDIAAIADLETVPFLQFTSDLEPKTEVLHGVFERDPSTATRVQTHSFTVDPGTTDLIVTVADDPGQSRDGPTDYLLRITPPQSEAIEVDDGGLGEPETFDLQGLDAIRSLGIGTWKVEVVLKSADANPTSPLRHPYQVTVEMDYRGTGVTFQFTTTEQSLVSSSERPGERAYLGWNMYLESMPDERTTFPLEVILVAHYDHAPSHSQYDDWRYTKTIELQVLPDPSGDAIIIRPMGMAETPDISGAFAWGVLSEVVGYISAVLILASIYTGGMFGKTSRRQLNAVFGTAKRRVAFHNFLSYAILLTAVVHTTIFLVEPSFDWTLGILWGGIAILAMIGLGVTGALQVPMIRKWNYATWRWSHFYLAIGTIVFTIVHILLDGVHFATVQEAVGWTNPFVESV